jgi:hypothetical protein
MTWRGVAATQSLTTDSTDHTDENCVTTFFIRVIRVIRGGFGCGSAAPRNLRMTSEFLRIPLRAIRG